LVEGLSNLAPALRLSWEQCLQAIMVRFKLREK
jgi:hypothetical protein